MSSSPEVKKTYKADWCLRCKLEKKAEEEKLAVDADGLVKVPYQTNFPFPSKTYINHDLSVKVGDKVKKDQLLGESNFTRNGTLALGKNLTVAYAAYHGVNSNDAVVISEGAAKKLTSEHMYREVYPLNAKIELSKHKHSVYFGNRYSQEQYAALDEHGIIKKGSKINPHDLLIAGVAKNELQGADVMLGRISKSLTKPFREVSLVWTHGVMGEVVEVVHSANQVAVLIKTLEPMQVGDKLAGRFGNKGVVSQIVPDHEMLQNEAGELAQGRVYAGGLTKFEPKEMERLLVPSPSVLSREDWPDGNTRPLSKGSPSLVPSPHWDDARLEKDRTKAIEEFREERLTEPLEAYLEVFESYRDAFDELLEETVDLTLLSEKAVDVLTDERFLEAVRYLAAPPMSTDDLITLAEAPSLAPKVIRADPKLAQRIIATVLDGLDRRRFPWFTEEREATERERASAVLASTALLATQRVTPLPTIPDMHLAEWPTEPLLRRSLTHSARALDDVRPLSGDSRLLLLAQWALACVYEDAAADTEGPSAPVLDAVAAMLGVSRATLARWRAEGTGGLDALALPGRGGARVGAGRKAGE